MSKFCQLWLTCKDRVEADNIAKTLLDKKLIACAKQTEISSDSHWQGKTMHAIETLLMMDSREDLFKEIEAEIARIHSYDTFVLQAVPAKFSKDAAKWMDDSLKK